MFHLPPVWRPKTTAVAVLCAGLFAGPALHAESIIGLTTTNALVLFDSAAPTMAGPAVTISGLIGVGESIVGIDARAVDRQLYGLGSLGNLYTLNAATGAATFMSALMPDPADASNPYTGLNGFSFGVDFNPVPDRLRITSNSGQNLRVNVATGATTTDGDLNGAVTHITGSAYTNNDIDPNTGTMLYGISSSTDMLYSQNPPNNGTLVAIGPLGVDTSAAIGFDISGATGRAFASLTNGDTAKSSLYSIDLATGVATLNGAFGIGGDTSIAPALLGLTVSAVPEPATMAMMIVGLGLVGGIARRRQRRN